MVVGLDKFREHFAGYAEQYVLIGGAATYLVLDEVGLEARATKDLDIVLCVESLSRDFAEAFWDFVKEAGYQIQQRSDGKKVFYRFQKPTNKDYPAMLELFSRAPDQMVLGEDSHLTPIPIDEEVSSLSAILLDEAYYAFLHAHKIQIDGVPVVQEHCLIPLKAKAWLDLTARKETGERVDSRDIKKHRSDILRLHQLFSAELRVELPETVKRDLASFLEAMERDESIDLKSLKIRGTIVPEIVQRLRATYEIE